MIWEALTPLVFLIGGYVGYFAFADNDEGLAKFFLNAGWVLFGITIICMVLTGWPFI